jgi:hypothetical protein
VESLNFEQLNHIAVSSDMNHNFHLFINYHYIGSVQIPPVAYETTKYWNIGISNRLSDARFTGDLHALAIHNVSLVPDDFVLSADATFRPTFSPTEIPTPAPFYGKKELLFYFLCTFFLSLWLIIWVPKNTIH